MFELLSVNLYELIKHNQFRGLSMNLLRLFMTQVTARATGKLSVCAGGMRDGKTHLYGAFLNVTNVPRKVYEIVQRGPSSDPD